MLKRMLPLAAATVLALAFAQAAQATDPPTLVADTTAAFGTQAQGTTSGSLGFTVTNPSTNLLPLVVKGETFGVDGSNLGADDFLVSSSTCGGSIPSGGTCEIRVRFVPQGTGARSAVMRVLTDAGDTNDLTLSGMGGPLPQGPPGADGKDGLNGTNGTNGTDGKDGTNGTDGKDGAPGPTGDPCSSSDPLCKGPKGDKGDRGARGPAGRDAVIACSVAKTKKTKKVKVICTVEFLNARKAIKIRARLSRGKHVVAAGHARTHHGRAALRLRGPSDVAAGRYRLTFVTIDRHGKARSGWATVRVR